MDKRCYAGPIRREDTAKGCCAALAILGPVPENVTVFDRHIYWAISRHNEIPADEVGTGTLYELLSGLEVRVACSAQPAGLAIKISLIRTASGHDCLRFFREHG